MTELLHDAARRPAFDLLCRAAAIVVLAFAILVLLPRLIGLGG